MTDKPITTNIGEEADKVFEIKEIGVLITNSVGTGILIATILTIAYLVWGAIDWIMSEGDAEKLKNAKSKITHALIGLVLVALAWLIWRLALNFLGIGRFEGGKVILDIPDTP